MVSSAAIHASISILALAVVKMLIIAVQAFISRLSRICWLGACSSAMLQATASRCTQEAQPTLNSLGLLVAQVAPSLLFNVVSVGYTMVAPSLFLNAVSGRPWHRRDRS